MGGATSAAPNAMVVLARNLRRDKVDFIVIRFRVGFGRGSVEKNGRVANGSIFLGDHFSGIFGSRVEKMSFGFNFNTAEESSMFGIN